MRVALLDDLVEAIPVEQADALERRVEVQVRQPPRVLLARHAVEDRHVHQVRHQRRQPVAAAAARTQPVAQKCPAVRNLVELDAPRLAGVEVDADDRAHAVHPLHHVDREVVERAAVAQEVAVGDHRRQRTRDGHARLQRLRQVAAADHVLPGLRVVGRHAEEVLPQVLDLRLEADEVEHGRAQDPLEPPALDQRQQRDQVVVAGRVGAERAPRVGQHEVERPVGRHARGHRGPDAGSADVVDLDAALRQGAPDAEVSEPARAAAGEDEPDRAAAHDSREPGQVGRAVRPHVHVEGDRAPVEPGAGSARGSRVRPVQQHEDLGRLGALGPAVEALRLDGVQGRRGVRVGEQQQLVAVAGAPQRPRRRAVVADQQHEVVARFHPFEQRQQAAGGLIVRVVALGEALVRQLAVDGGGVEHAHAAVPGEVRRELRCERARVHACRDRHDADHHRLRELGPRLRVAQVADHLARQRDRQLRAARDQPVELRLRQPHEHRVADGHDGRRARLAGDEAHLADRVAASHLPHQPLGAVGVAHVRAQPAADREVHRVAGLALRQQRLAAGDRDPLEPPPQSVQHRRLDVGQDPGEMLRQQFVRVALAGGGGVHRGGGGRRGCR